MKILFVCMGNICRSPTAEGVFRKLASESHLADELVIDSAGTHGYHAGRPPDLRSIAHAAKRGIDLSDLRAREVVAADFEHFDHVIAMDESNIQQLMAICPHHLSGKIELLLTYADACNAREVPDPYYGQASDFELVLDLIEKGNRGLVNHLIAQRASSRSGQK